MANVFAAVPVCVAGGLILLWAYPHLWDLLHVLGIASRPSPGPIHLTVAVVVGGMLVELFSLFIVPAVYCWVAEVRLRRST